MYFTRKEFQCSCGCGFDTVDYELMMVLNDVREWFDAPVTVTSGCRCPSHNKTIGGAENSIHMTGKAADIVVKGIEPRIVADYLEDKYENKYGIGRYSGWVHIDVRPIKARWKK